MRLTEKSLLISICLLCLAFLESFNVAAPKTMINCIARWRGLNMQASANQNRRIRKEVRSPIHKPASPTATSSSSRAEGTRINKCLPSLSRRSADDAIESGRVSINSQLAKAGDRVHRGDVVRLDGKIQPWEVVAAAKQQQPARKIEERDFVYLKYWKPRGVTCTSDLSDKTNIIAAGKFHLFPQRLFTIGRLDKASTGLILLTSDGRVNNAILSPKMSKEKVYEVSFNAVPTDSQVEQLRSGVIITTPVQRDGDTKLVTAKTLPCRVKRLSSPLKQKNLEITLTEGRNRQIRRMAESIGLQVIDLHRTSFCGISLRGLSEDNWLELNELEMEKILSALEPSHLMPREQLSSDDESIE